MDANETAQMVSKLTRRGMLCKVLRDEDGYSLEVCKSGTRWASAMRGEELPQSEYQQRHLDWGKPPASYPEEFKSQVRKLRETFEDMRQRLDRLEEADAVDALDEMAEATFLRFEED